MKRTTGFYGTVAEEWCKCGRWRLAFILFELERVFFLEGRRLGSLGQSEEASSYPRTGITGAE